MSWVMFGASPHQIEARAKNRTPAEIDAPAPQTVAQRAADQHQHGQHQRISFDEPLRFGDARAEFALPHGSATLTTVPSMNVMLEPRIAAANTHRPAA